MSYDKKFREKALEALESGSTIAETAKVFGISPNTLCVWKRQYKETGTLERKYRSYSTRIPTSELKDYLGENPDAYLQEIAEHFGCCASAISYRMKQENITRKKRLLPIKSKMPKK